MNTDISNTQDIEAQVKLAKSFNKVAKYYVRKVRELWADGFLDHELDSAIDSEVSQIIREATRMIPTEEEYHISFKNTLEALGRGLVEEMRGIPVEDKNHIQHLSRKYIKIIRDGIYVQARGNGLVSAEIESRANLGYRPPLYN